PSHAQVQRQARRHFPIVLEKETELLGGYQKVRIAVGLRHAGDRAGSGEFPWIVFGVVQNYTRVGRKIDLEGRAELEETALRRVVDEIYSALERVSADRLGEVVPKLPLALPGLLRNVGVGAERCVRKGHQRRADTAGDQI